MYEHPANSGTPLSAFLKVLFGAEYLKMRGAPLLVAVLPDFLIDLDATETVEKAAASATLACKGPPHRRIALSETRPWRAGGHATIAAMAVQMLHSPEWPLFELTYIAKSGTAGEACMRECLVDRLRGYGHPMDLSCVLTGGQDRLTFVREFRHDSMIRHDRYVQALDRRQMRWADLVSSVARPLDRLARADVIGVFSPRSTVFRETLEKLPHLCTGDSAQRVAVVDLTNLRPSEDDKSERKPFGFAELTKALAPLREDKRILPVISLGSEEVEEFRRSDKFGSECLHETVRRIQQACGCPVVFHHSLFAFVVDPQKRLGDGSEQTVPSFDLANTEARNGVGDCFAGGLTLALGVRQKLLRLKGVPHTLIPSAGECLLMGGLLSAALLVYGAHPESHRIHQLARKATPVTSIVAIEQLKRQSRPGITEDDVRSAKLPESAGTWSNGVAETPSNVFHPTWVERQHADIRGDLARSASGGGASSLLKTLGDILAIGEAAAIPSHLGCRSPTCRNALCDANGKRHLSGSTIDDIWQAIDACPDDDIGRLMFSAYVRVLALDHRFHAPADATQLSPSWARSVDADIFVNARPCVLVDLDGTLFDSKFEWRAMMSNALAQLVVPKDARELHEAVDEMEDRIYANNAFFLKWGKTRLDTRQVWCDRRHFLAFLAARATPLFRRLAEEDHKTQGQSGKNSQKLTDEFLQSPEGKRLLQEYEAEYARLEGDRGMNERIRRAVAEGLRTPCLPFLDARPLLHLLQIVADVYVVTEGDESVQNGKLQRLGLFVDERTQAVRTEHVLTTGAAANPEAEIAILDNEIQLRETKQLQSQALVEGLNKAHDNVRDIPPPVSELTQRVQKLCGEATNKDRVDDAVEGIIRSVRDPLVECVEGLTKLPKSDLERYRTDVEGLRFIKSLFDNFRAKGPDTAFYARCLQAIQQAQESRAADCLHHFNLPPDDGQPQPLKIMVIGDRLTRDCLPLHELCTESVKNDKLAGMKTDGLRPVTTFRVLTGHYKTEDDEWMDYRPGLPSFVVSSLSEAISIVLRKRTWAQAAAVGRVSLLRGKPTDSSVRGLALARQIEHAPAVVGQMADLLLGRYLYHFAADFFAMLAKLCQNSPPEVQGAAGALLQEAMKRGYVANSGPLWQSSIDRSSEIKIAVVLANPFGNPDAAAAECARIGDSRNCVTWFLRALCACTREQRSALAAQVATALEAMRSRTEIRPSDLEPLIWIADTLGPPDPPSQLNCLQEGISPKQGEILLRLIAWGPSGLNRLMDEGNDGEGFVAGVLYKSNNKEDLEDLVARKLVEKSGRHYCITKAGRAVAKEQYPVQFDEASAG